MLSEEKERKKGVKEKEGETGPVSQRKKKNPNQTDQVQTMFKDGVHLVKFEDPPFCHLKKNRYLRGLGGNTRKSIFEVGPFISVAQILIRREGQPNVGFLVPFLLRWLRERLE